MKPLPCIAAVGVLSAALAGVMGCATTPSTPAASTAPSASAPGHTAKQAAALPGKPGCFWLMNFDGSWTALSDDELIVYAPLYNQPYLIKLFEPVINLKFDQALGFLDTERTGMICNSNLDDVVVPHWQPHNIPIVAVRQLTVAEADQLLKSHGIKSPYGNGKSKHAQAAGPPAG